ncbi:hypothetical protein [Stutzerimonas zhaodongensis]|uniref:Integrase n=1 Tax=Stutzerimonas zhaodongensis TaxID=1176257 RepID=A0ABX8J0M7_9GAMM|nr:hypothetical protein [Stutzerimonas zhaodongensis]QWV18603.1 hypothetical protein KQ248_08060 [Stutzerimonas zhaodongensis]
MKRLVQRANTEIITLSELTEDYTQPELLRLKVSENVMKKPLDIGSFAYAIRGKNLRAQDDRGNPVVISSFIPSRREMIKVLLGSFIGLRDTSVVGIFTNTAWFIDWLNANGYKDIFVSEGEAQLAFRDYTAYLNERILHGNMKPLTASNYQTSAARLLELLYPKHSHYIAAGAVAITRERGSEMMDAEHVDVYRDVCLTLARQGREFVLSNKPYPAVMDFGSYEVVVFPSTVGAITPFRKASPTYNAVERRISTVDEYLYSRKKLGLKKKHRSQAAKDLDDARRTFAASNEDERHWHRVEVARLAAKAYASLFLMITGASMSEFAQFTFKDALDVEQSPIKKELVSIKFRARGKVTRYNIGRSYGLVVLREYLELRSWILNGAESELLFFSIPLAGRREGKDGFTPLKSTSMKTFYTGIKGVYLDPNVSHFSPRKIRKQKSNTMHFSRVAARDVATAMNHGVSINISTYSDPAPSQLEAELSLFWRSVKHAADLVRDRSESGGAKVSVASGHCAEFEKPTPIPSSGGALSVPSCTTQLGCLYCKNYMCHGDEEDLHKLMSLQYVINAVRNMSADEQHAENLFRELSLRIEFVIEALEEQSSSVKEIVRKLRKSVFDNGELTLFWEKRLSRYERMGVVF